MGWGGGGTGRRCGAARAAGGLALSWRIRVGRRQRPASGAAARRAHTQRLRERSWGGAPSGPAGRVPAACQNQRGEVCLPWRCRSQSMRGPWGRGSCQGGTAGTTTIPPKGGIPYSTAGSGAPAACCSSHLGAPDAQPQPGRRLPPAGHRAGPAAGGPHVAAAAAEHAVHGSNACPPTHPTPPHTHLQRQLAVSLLDLPLAGVNRHLQGMGAGPSPQRKLSRRSRGCPGGR